ncbi:DUF3617 domain-containing protein [Azomonas macrocytogenes]|uniref:DUF3617 domain-containing protein n=1 Tax=Azomonas macrocytogenes TaxID=69962 RepID=A0A839T6A4_AZOMA|nr:DUF3617 domain-containing protein [Azomonas macrocytogenes]MBB3103213.1 hypothetical protein [Azomonas macrocytogenes]
MKIRITTLTLVACLSATPLQAQVIDPGLWEITSPNMEIDGWKMPSVPEILGSLPQEQRQNMEGILRQRGVELAGQDVRVCLTREQVEANELPLQDPQSGCRQQITDRNASAWKFRFECPDTRGTGEARFISSKEFQTTIDSTFTTGNVERSGKVETHSRWLQADCGAVKPVQ